MSRLQNLRVSDPVLSELAQGYEAQNLFYSKLFPIVPSEVEGGKIPFWGNEAQKTVKTERAIRAGSNSLTPEATGSVSFSMTEHDLSYPIDLREVSDSVMDIETQATYTTSELIGLQIEKKASTIARDASKYDTANKVTLSSTEKFDTSTSDPIGVFQTAMDALKKKLGNNYETCVIIPQEVWNALRKHADIKDLFNQCNSGLVKPEMLADLLDLKGQVYIADSVIDENYIWGKDIVIGVVPKVATSANIRSYGYTVRKKDYPKVDIFMSEGDKIENVRTTDILDIVLTSSNSGYLIKDCVS